MLYRNDEIYKLKDSDVAFVENFFHNKFPVKVIYPPERVIPSRLKHNRLPDKPNSSSFDLRELIKTDTGTEVWRYADNVLVSNSGQRTYVPKKFLLKGKRFLKRDDIELIWFLLTKSHYRKGATNQGRIVKFMFEDLVSEADKKVAQRQMEKKVNDIIFDEELGMTEEKITDVAKAYNINTDGLTLNQLRIRVDEAAHADKKGLSHFFEMVNADKELATKKILAGAIQSGHLKFFRTKREWKWQTGDKAGEVICVAPANKAENDALYDHYNGDHSFQENLNALLLQGSAVGG